MLKGSKLVMGCLALALAAVPASADATVTSFWQCAPFARMFSGVQLFGAAAGWWSQAVGKYSRGGTPKEGAVLVFKAIGSMRSGHVATVSQVVSDRVIKVTHANWSSRGQIERDVEVMDVSARNDWSRVRVWYKGLRDLGTSSYPVYGFIYGGKARAAAEAVPAKTRDADATLKASRSNAPLAALVG